MKQLLQGTSMQSLARVSAQANPKFEDIHTVVKAGKLLLPCGRRCSKHVRQPMRGNDLT